MKSRGETKRVGNLGSFQGFSSEKKEAPNPRKKVEKIHEKIKENPQESMKNE